MKFILFDIDGTLIDSGGAGVRSLNLAFEELFSVADAFRTVQMAGKTDPQIMREGLLLHGFDPGNGVIPRFCDTYVSYLSKGVRTADGHLKPGVQKLLDALIRIEDVRLGLLTGNLEKGARIKLEVFGLNRFFPVGAYGNDSEDRNRLLPVAVENLFKQFSLQVPFEDCIIIGDTPLDVACAKPYGAFSVAVATGHYPMSVLAESKPDVLFSDLSDTDRVLSEILG